MPGLFSWIRERLSPEVTPTTRRKRSNAWLGNDGDERANDGDETAVAVTGTSTGAASGRAEVRKVAFLLGCCVLVSVLCRMASVLGAWSTSVYLHEARAH